jgi:hypothetical protein
MVTQAKTGEQKYDRGYFAGCHGYFDLDIVGMHCPSPRHVNHLYQLGVVLVRDRFRLRSGRVPARSSGTGKDLVLSGAVTYASRLP